MIKNFNINKNSTQSGRSMIEMLGVLAIVGVLSVGGIAGYSKAMTKFKINKTIDQVSHIVANTRTLFAQQNNYQGLYSGYSADEVIKSIIPDSVNPNNMLNPFNGVIGIYSVNNWQADKSEKAFTVEYRGLPQEACVSLATHDWGSLQTSGLIAISVSNGVACGPYDATKENCEYYAGEIACSGNNEKPTPMNVATAAASCQCEELGCTVSWKFQ